MAHDVFISYSSADQPAALAVLHGLEAAGVRCWMAPRDIGAGAIWASAIMDGINGSRVMVVVFSASANRSPHVLNEVDAAVRKGAIIVPIRIENIMPDGAMEFHLRTRHWLDALTPDLESHTGQLAAQIKMLLAGPQLPFTPTPPPRPMPLDLPPRRTTTPPPVRAATPRDWRRYRWVALAVVVGAAAFAIWSTGERSVGDVAFVIRESSGSGGNQSSLNVTTGTLRFFEGGDSPPALGDRDYRTGFSSATTRKIYPEIKLLNEAPGRTVNVPISCQIFGPGGSVSGAVTINGAIEPTWKESYSTHGYGDASGGKWSRGHYRTECSYGNTLINRGWFDVVDSTVPGGRVATRPGSPPPVAPPPPPAANVAYAATEPLRSLNGWISAVKFFESGSVWPAPADRRYTRSFSAQTARYINVEVTLRHDAPGRLVTAMIYCRYFRDRTNFISREDLSYTIQPDWRSTFSAAGWGSLNAGTWRAGTYFISCNDGQKTLSESTFEVF